ncbi:MtrAB system histidine kinase MtrB [Aeromicrobium alkaliterrae]|uniref:Sensor histidine kinase MtrB n=1 Tax=Aeromicrobium alkaliterrae TaxID=302168 RepID=A0ABP4VUD3_9ACTN
MTSPREGGWRRAGSAVAGFWRRSLRLRVVGSTVALTSLAIGLTGWALLAQVADGLAEARSTSAVAEARAGFDRVRAQLETTAVADAAAASEAVAQIVDSLTQSGQGEGRYDVVVAGPLGEPGEPSPVRSSGNVAASAIPEDLVESVGGSDGLFWRFAEIPVTGGETRPVVVVGSRLDVPSTGDDYGIYYVFSTADQQATLNLVRNALALAGLAMIVMVAGVALVMSRQVLEPVRLARRTAERFAAGHLEQRMHVRGEDDLARLSESFNQMAASLQSQIARLENLSKLQQRFVSDVSHELRTPLTTIKMAGDVLHEARSGWDPSTARAAELLHRELQRFEELLADLMDLSRFDAGAAQLELEPVDLAEVARRVVDDPVLSRKHIDVRVVGANRPVVTEADLRRVDRVLRNLVANAAAYSRSKDVVVTVAQNSDCVSLSVRDHGVGLTSEESLRVFDRFWRADPARAAGGTGLGLSIARGDARLHGGDLRVGSVAGRGTDFVLTLPKPGGDAKQPALEPMREPGDG